MVYQLYGLKEGEKRLWRIKMNDINWQELVIGGFIGFIFSLMTVAIFEWSECLI